MDQPVSNASFTEDSDDRTTLLTFCFPSHKANFLHQLTGPTAQTSIFH
jgi:hypothetical protein